MLADAVSAAVVEHREHPIIFSSPLLAALICGVALRPLPRQGAPRRVAEPACLSCRSRSFS